MGKSHIFWQSGKHYFCNVNIQQFKKREIMKRLFIMSLICCVLACFNLSAQQSFVSSGGNASASSGSVSYSIGQLFYSNYQGAEFSLMEGVQQPYEIFMVEVDDYLLSDISFNIYPNPVQDLLVISSTAAKSEYSYLLTDSKASILNSGIISSPSICLNMAAYQSGTYFVTIFMGKESVITYKIIKNQ